MSRPIITADPALSRIIERQFLRTGAREHNGKSLQNSWENPSRRPLLDYNGCAQAWPERTDTAAKAGKREGYFCRCFGWCAPGPRPPLLEGGQLDSGRDCLPAGLFGAESISSGFQKMDSLHSAVASSRIQAQADRVIEWIQLNTSSVLCSMPHTKTTRCPSGGHEAQAVGSACVLGRASAL